MKLAFIGAGNMASAMVRGFVAAGAAKAGDISVYDTNAEVAAALQSATGVEVAATAKDAVKGAELVFLCVKPQVLPGVLEELAAALEGKTAVSIAAGTPLALLEEKLGKNAAAIRVMPNVNMAVGASMSAMCANANTSEEMAGAVFTLLGTVGRVVKIAEKDFAIFSAIAGCSPAYTFVFIDAISRAAVQYGLPKAVATEIAAQAVLGSAANLLQSGETPWQMVDKVCSPGGTTIAGLAALEEAAFPAVVAEGIRAAYLRDIEMQQQNG